MRRLDGKVVVISGAALGMGASHARAVIREGGAVVIGDIEEEAGRALAAELGPNALFGQLDVRSPESWAAFVRLAEDSFGGVDVLVNNAGILRRTSVEDAPLDEWNLVMAINATGMFLGMQAVIPSLRRRGGGSIINVSSTSGLRGYPGSFSYGASKWAVRGMTKHAAADLAPYNIRVNSVHPGHIRTRMADGFNDVSAIHLGRAGEPEEISALVVFLASEESSFSTGSEFVADGGETSAPVVVDSLRRRS